MKIGITHRLFLSILVCTCLAILSMFLIMQWSIHRGFLRYLNTMEQSRMEQLTERLEQAYSEHGSWDFLRDKPRFWIMQLLNTRPDDESAKSRDIGRRENVPHFSPRGVREPGFPIFVLDAERKPVIGSIEEIKDANLNPITHNGETVGYIGLLPPRHFLNPHQAEFLRRQKMTLILAAFGMALLVALFSIPLSNRLIRPIRAVTEATHDLASGKYTVRVPISSSDEIGQLARDFNEMALTLEKNEKARRQWIADISHELRTPLSVLRGEIEALMEGIRKTTPEAVASLHSEALRLHRLIEDLYQLSLSDLGALTYRKENLDLTKALRDSIEPYREEFEHKKIKLRVNISQEPEMMVFADRERLQQLFMNLLDNSLKYTDAGGELIIRMKWESGKAAIDFEDSAPGVPETELDRLFDRLYRVEGSRSRSSGGAGLGLAICKNIVEAHGGTISAHSSPVGGLLIRVILPIAERRS